MLTLVATVNNKNDLPLDARMRVAACELGKRAAGDLLVKFCELAGDGRTSVTQHFCTVGEGLFKPMRGLVKDECRRDARAFLETLSPLALSCRQKPAKVDRLRRQPRCGGRRDECGRSRD